MKKIVLFIWVIVFPAMAFCQLRNLIGKETVNDKTRFGLILGMGISHVQLEYNENTMPGFEKPDSKPGFITGVYLQTRLNKNIIIQPALLLVNKGMEEKNPYYSIRTNLAYLEVPLNILYKPISAKGSFFIGGGPAPSYYIGETIFYSGYNEFQKFDFGINILTGYEFPIGFSLNLNYTHGLLNISRDKNNIPVFRNRNIGFSLGYTF